MMGQPGGKAASFTVKTERDGARDGSQQTLLIDADDTLWENNRYFEEAIARFITFVDHHEHTAEEMRERLNRAERATIAAHGYGLRSFRASLTRCLEEVLEASATDAQVREIAGFVDYIEHHAIELLDGVAETLRELAKRHRLLLVTKGNPEEQMAKLEMSGLQGCFVAVEVLREKDLRSYRELVGRYELDPRRTTMIGNSPKSDINPALAAGLDAVLIPHPYTWVLEHEPVDVAPSGQRLLELRTFAELIAYF